MKIAGLVAAGVALVALSACTETLSGDGGYYGNRGYYGDREYYGDRGYYGRGYGGGLFGSSGFGYDDYDRGYRRGRYDGRRTDSRPAAPPHRHDRKPDERPRERVESRPPPTGPFPSNSANEDVGPINLTH